MRPNPGFCKHAIELAEQPDRRAGLGASGRQYAETHFSESVVIGELMTQLRLAMPTNGAWARTGPVQ